VIGSSTIEPLNLDHFENEFFREAIRRHVQEYAAHFGERLAAIYVSGSVHRNEAVPGISDLDLHPFISDSLADADQEWWQGARQAMDQEFGKIHGLGQPRSVTREFIAGAQAASADRYTVVSDPADGTLRWLPDPTERKAKLAHEYGLLLRYDATVVWGRDLIEGLQIPPPDATWARVWFLSPWELTRYAAGLTRENQTAGEHDLPEGPRLRLHELAKLAKLGGAALLMARGEFRSFRYADVFPALKQIFRQWAPFLDESTESYFPATDPTRDEVTAYLSRLAAWMEWIGAQLYDAAVRSAE
jgi:hypothetical protein